MPHYDYTQEFQDALSRSSELGLIVPQVTFPSARFYSDEKFNLLLDRIHKQLVNQDGTFNLAFQCLTLNLNIRSAVESVFGCGAHLTFGYIQECEDKYFEFSYSKVEDWLSNGTYKKEVELHAWLTLDSMEIIDLTWPTTRAKILKSQYGIGASVTRHPDEFEEGLEYHPMIVGHDFPYKIKAVHGIVIALT